MGKKRDGQVRLTLKEGIQPTEEEPVNQEYDPVARLFWESLELMIENYFVLMKLSDRIWTEHCPMGQYPINGERDAIDNLKEPIAELINILHFLKNVHVTMPI